MIKKLIFLFLIIVSCEKTVPEITPPDKNTVFMATAGDIGRYVIIRDQYNSYQISKGIVKADPQYKDPDCDSPDNGGYWTLYLKPGVYELTIQSYAQPGYVYKTITIYDACNKFNIDQINKW